MYEILTSAVFKYLAIPLLTTLLNIFVKANSRSKDNLGYSKEDFAVGLQILMTAITIFLLHCVTSLKALLDENKLPVEKINAEKVNILQNQLLISPWIILVLVFSLWGFSSLISKHGWEDKDKATWIVGIILPVTYGLIVLSLVIIWIGDYAK